MPDFPSVLNINSIKPFFEHVQNAGLPGKVSQNYLASVGFKSKNDRGLIGLAKHLGFFRFEQFSVTPMARVQKQIYCGGDSGPGHKGSIPRFVYHLPIGTLSGR